MRLRVFSALIPLVLLWPSLGGQVAVKNPLTRPQGRPGAAYMLTFDTQTVQAAEGRVTRIHSVPSPQVWLSGVQVVVQTAQGELHVLLGPTWFIDNQELHLAVGDTVHVVGSRVRPHGVDAMVAMEVKRGDDVLTLRGPDGLPVWVAWRWQASPEPRAGVR